MALYPYVMVDVRTNNDLAIQYHTSRLSDVGASSIERFRSHGELYSLNKRSYA